MATVRVTPSAALPLVRQLTTDLRRFVGDAGALSAAPHLLRQLDDLLAACAATMPLVVEAWLEDGTDPEAAAHWLLGAAPDRLSITAEGRRVAEASLGGRRVRIVFATSTNSQAWTVGASAAALTVWFHGDTPSVDPEGVDERPVLHVLRPGAAPLTGARESVSVPREVPDGLMLRVLASTKEPLADMLHADAVARALEALAAIAGLALAQEGRSIRAKRTLAQQHAAATQTRAPVPLGDLVNGLRTRLQRVFLDFTRGLDDRFVSAITAPSADFWSRLDEILQQFDRVDQEQRVKIVATRLPQEFQTSWLDFVRSYVRMHGVADLSALRDMLRAESVEVEKVVGRAGGPPVTVQFQALTDERLERLLDQSVAAPRTYQGELPRPGFFEYLMIARRYQAVVFMLLSAFGLSLVRTYREFMIPAAVLLLSLGALQVTQSVRKERVESVQKELDKIRELLRSETKRMVGEVHRAWVAVLSQHLSDQLPVVLGQVETSVKDHFSRLANEGADGRQRLQRQLQAFEVAERKLLGPEKGRETVAHAAAHVRGELRQLVAQALRSATR